MSLHGTVGHAFLFGSIGSPKKDRLKWHLKFIRQAFSIIIHQTRPAERRNCRDHITLDLADCDTLRESPFFYLGIGQPAKPFAVR
jgi:hypothetical protein